MKMIPQVLQLNEQGIPITWIPWQRVAFFKCKDLVAYEFGEHDWTKYGGVSRITGTRSSITYSSIVAIKGSAMPKRTVPPLTNINLFARDLRVCAYCGHEYGFKELTNDHIIPRSRGGKHSWLNCITSCKGCNNYKSDSSLESLDMKLLYQPYAPSREEALILRNRNILADQMDFLQKFLPSHSRQLRR